MEDRKLFNCNKRFTKKKFCRVTWYLQLVFSRHHLCHPEVKNKLHN